MTMSVNNVDNLERAVTNLFALFPLVKKKFMNPDSIGIQCDLSHSHFQILILLNEIGILPVSEIAKKLMISRPNMTPLIDKLIEEGLVKRIPSETDRRVIHIALTDEGNKFLEDHQKLMSNYLKKRFSCLSDEDLIQLAQSLENIKKVFLKIN
jgi:DNA-binding MarR family transcriptional regulator